MVVVVAGYAHDIDGLMQSNPGLASRFPETLHFPSFDVQDSSRLLEAALKKGFNTDFTPDAAATLPELLPPLVQVRASHSQPQKERSGQVPNSVFDVCQLVSCFLLSILIFNSISLPLSLFQSSTPSLFLSLPLASGVDKKRLSRHYSV